MKRSLRNNLPLVAGNLIRVLLILAMPVFTAAVFAQGLEKPEVLKVEPPNWWAGHSIGVAGSPLRLMIRGKNLKSARVEAVKRGIRLSNIRVNDAGTYLFADVIIDRLVRPGSYPVKIVTPAGTAQAPFDLIAPLPRTGNFQGFNQDDVIYLIMPDRFANGDASNDDPQVSRGITDRSKARYYHGGDLQGVIDKLPYLKELGVTAIWLNPIYNNNDSLNQREQYPEVPGGPNKPVTDYHGYGAVDFYSVEEHFGDLDKLKELVQAAHRIGIKIIQDQVANHSGPFHPWVTDSPTPTWFNGTQTNHLAENWQTHLLMDKYASQELLKPVLDGWFVDILPDMNQNDPEAAKYIIQNTLWWIGVSGMDAIRQDTLPYVPRKFWREWMTAIKREYPNVNVVGETLDGLPSQVAFFQGGVKRFDGIDSKVDTEFDYPLYFAIRKVFGEGQSIRQLIEIVNQDYLYPDPDRLVTLLGSHDVLRFMNERGATVDGLKLAFTFLATYRGIPQLYYGDEIAIRGGNDPDNRRDFPGGWAGDARNAFEPSGRNAEEQSVFEHLRKALKLRAELEPLRRGRTMHLAIEDQTYAFARYTDRKTVVVAFNNDVKPVTINAALPSSLKIADGAVLRNRLGSGAEVRVQNGRISFTLDSRSSVVLE
ncbi:MAG: cyclomaltodextrinase N-terminal domain-containing protein [Acidobacteria bacterium]|nr:cyclomaltodextrinase N-terminal domain-containing protein [Acidobacteriota bacterium]